MIIREAKDSDKKHIVKFCQNTFSWGDYIQDVWNSWLSEGTLLIIEKEIPIGVCHGVFSKNQLWIEGIRINSNFRRKGLASKLIKRLESIASKKKISRTFMLIDTENSPSLLMAQQNGYKIYQTWKFYSLIPQKNNYSEIYFGNIIKVGEYSHYVKSWRWIPLNKQNLTLLNSKNCIVYSKKTKNKAIAILVDSEHFEKTLVVTLFSGSKKDTMNIILFLQNFGFEKKYYRIQILTKEILPELKNLEHKISFHLMQKLLS